MKKLLIFLVIIAVLAGAAYYLFPTLLPTKKTDAQLQSFEDCVEAGNLVVETYPRECHTKSKQVFLEEGNQKIMEDVIKVKEPEARNVLSSPFKVEGEAIGGWYYNKQLTVRVVDHNQTVIGTGNAKAQAEVTDSNSFVPFIGVLYFEASEAAKGSLIIEKANPGNPEIKSTPLVIPIRFK